VYIAGKKEKKLSTSRNHISKANLSEEAVISQVLDLDVVG